MPRGRISIDKAIAERKAIQQEIRERFGEDIIKKAKRRLCAKCEEAPCFLLPICRDGSDCPYFKLKEKE